MVLATKHTTSMFILYDNTSKLAKCNQYAMHENVSELLLKLAEHKHSVIVRYIKVMMKLHDMRNVCEEYTGHQKDL